MVRKMCSPSLYCLARAGSARKTRTVSERASKLSLNMLVLCGSLQCALSLVLNEGKNNKNKETERKIYCPGPGPQKFFTESIFTTFHLKVILLAVIRLRPR